MSRSYTISVPVRTFWRIVVPGFVAALIVGAIAGVLIVDRVVMPNIVGVNKGIVTVPDITGMDFEAGRQRLYDIGLIARVKEEEFNDTVAAGAVARQFVTPGEKVKKGRHIDVAVSRGPIAGTIPAVGGMAEHVARLELRKKGFTVGKVAKQYNSRVAKGSVIGTSPPEGTTISREMRLTLRVSNGPRPTHATMVNVVGERLGQARAKIQEAGLSVGNIDYRDNPSLAPGTIPSQSVPPGTNVPLGDPVNLVVSVVKR